MSESIKDKYTVSRIDYETCKPWLLYKHYAHRIPSISYAFGLFDNNKRLQGVCTFGTFPNYNLNDICGEKYKDNVLELNRLIKNDGLEKNIQSYFVSQCFNFLPKPMIIISFSDPNYNHNRYTYQSLNFYYTGLGGV